MHQSHTGRPHVRPLNTYNQVPPPPQLMRPAHYLAAAPPNSMQPQHPSQTQQMMSQYIPTASAHPQSQQTQRNDPNRLGHLMAQQQPTQQTQRISPQMIQSQPQQIHPTQQQQIRQTQQQQIHHTGLKQRPQQLQATLHQQNLQSNIINHHHGNPGINHNIVPNNTIGLQNPAIKHHINTSIPQSIPHAHINTILPKSNIAQQHQATNKHSGNSVNNNYHGKIHTQKINKINNVNNHSNNITKTNITTIKKEYNVLHHHQTNHIQKFPAHNQQKVSINSSHHQPKVTILKNQNRNTTPSSLNISSVNTKPSVTFKPPVNSKLHNNFIQNNNNVNSNYTTQTKPSLILNQNIPQTNSSVANITNKENTLDNAILTKNSSNKENSNENEKNNNLSTEINNNLNNNLSNNLKKSQILSSESLPNGKEKTPMCLVNELARYNKIQHQYRLTGEQGPAHSKRFTVTLKLGDEEYTAEGPSIKKAQHTAADEAVGKTKYDHPPPKTVRHKSSSRNGTSSNITPTVELNALAMKLGELTVYVFDSAAPNTSNFSTINQSNDTPIVTNQANYQEQCRTHPNNIYINGGNNRFQGNYRGRAQRGHLKYGATPRMTGPYNNFLSNQRDACKITLIVGKEKFTGVGPSVQMAKHDAASKALEIMRPLGEAFDNNFNSHDNSLDDSNSDVKSPISQVHEVALKRNFTVSFEVKSEVGPPHLKTFITTCKVGNIVVEAEGNGKKISKKRAADKMLEELKKLPPLSPDRAVVSSTTTPPNKAAKGRGKQNHSQQNQSPTKKKTKNISKEKGAETSQSKEEGNPISKLIQIQQSLKAREPVYTVVEEKGAPRRREFTVEVVTNDKSARGIGSTKKMAKKNAARKLLAVLGQGSSSGSNSENSINIANVNEQVTSTVNSIKENPRPVSAVSQSGVSSRQIVPGMLHLPLSISTSSAQTQQNNNKQPIKPKILSQIPEEKPLEIKAVKITEIPIEVKSTETTEENARENVNNEVPKEFGIRPKDQLLYLSELLGFQVGFTDYPKGNHGEFLTIVTLSTDPPQICHGAGQDTISSQDKASLKALQMLQALKLDNLIKPKQNDEKTSKITTSDNS